MSVIKRKIVSHDELIEICTTRLHAIGFTDFTFQSFLKLVEPDPDSGCNWTWAVSAHPLLKRITTTELNDAAYAEAMNEAKNIARGASVEFNIE